MSAELPGLAIALIIFQFADAIACIGPIAYIKRALDKVDCPESVRSVLPWIKAASALGLTIGLWVPIVGLITIIALVVYFLIAIWFHVRVSDTVKNTVGAVLLLILVSAVGVFCYLPAI